MPLTLNPFRKLPNGKAVWAWGMYDLANQSFTLIINTLLFSIFFKEVVVGGTLSPADAAADPDLVAQTAARADSLWSITFSASMFVVVLLSPFVGALADARAWRRRFLLGTGLVCVAMTCALAGLSAGTIALAILLYIPANIAYQIGENFLASFLPSVSTPRTIGRVSAIGWTMGYVGALLLLVFCAAGMKLFNLGHPADWGPFFIFAGLWFLLGMTPTALFLPEPPANPAPRGVSIARATLDRMADTLHSAAHYTHLVRFLTAFFVYGMGVQVIIAFASILARDFNFDTTKLVLFVLQLTVTAGIAAIVTARYQDRIGTRVTIMAYLVIWLASASGLFVVSLLTPRPEWAFWLAGNGIGLGIGGIGTASRAMVGRFTPQHKTAEFFGLWGMVYKLAGVVGVLAFGQIKAWIGLPAALALLAGFFVGGMLLLLRVSETAGLRAARRAERGALPPKPPVTPPHTPGI